MPFLDWFLPCFYACAACLGFCVPFNIRGLGAVICSLGGGLAWLVYLIAGPLTGYHDLMQYFWAAVFLSAYSEGMARVQHTRLAASPLSPWLEGVYISEELGAQKPQRAFFDRAFAGMGVRDKSRAVMVGDGLQSDIKGGIAAGIDTIWYNPGGLPPAPDAFPTYTAADYGDVRRLILSGSRQTREEHLNP